MRVQLPGFIWGEVEELVIEEFCAFHEAAVLAVGLPALPTLRVRVISVVVVPPHNRHVCGIVRPVRCRADEVVKVVGADIVDTNARNSAHLALVVGLVHGLAPAIGNLGVPVGHTEVLHGLEVLEPLERPILDDLRGRRQTPAALRCALLDDVRHVEAAQGERVAGGSELVSHLVRAQKDHRAGGGLDLIGLRISRVERLEV
mmetsp:Transcript_122727/g.382089  ORF Transcript_122727/g.382089 Transcript_122727/m.382089 type:complete len:202 (+) Transcript_122727:1287-1892(+)